MLEAEALSGGFGLVFHCRCCLVAGLGATVVALRARHGLADGHPARHVAFAWASLLGAGDLYSFALICIASGLALGADLALPAAIAADLGERQGQAGACFGVWNFVAKLNLAIAAGLALPLLGQFGYVPGGSDGSWAR